MKRTIKLISQAAIFSLVLFSVTSAYAYMFNDPINNVWPGQGNPDDYDRIGRPVFEIYGLNITYTNSTTTFDIFSNYPQGGYLVGSWHTFPADLALDINGDNIYEYGLALTTHDGVIAGTLYDVTDWNISDGYAPPGGYIYHHGRIVTIGDGTAISDGNSVNWFDNDAGTDPNVPDWRINLVLNNSDFIPAGFVGNYNFFYGGASCANDFIGGSVHIIPEPTTMALLGMGLLGCGIFRKKRRG